MGVLGSVRLKRDLRESVRLKPDLRVPHSRVMVLAFVEILKESVLELRKTPAWLLTPFGGEATIVS